jgi:hypothetical protein
MPNGPDFNDPAYWLTKAEEARSLAEKMEFLERRLSMLILAKAYSRIAEAIEERRSRH